VTSDPGLIFNFRIGDQVLREAVLRCRNAVASSIISVLVDPLFEALVAPSFFKSQPLSDLMM